MKILAVLFLSASPTFPSPSVVLSCYSADSLPAKAIAVGGGFGSSDSYQAEHYRTNNQGGWDKDAHYFCIAQGEDK